MKAKPLTNTDGAHAGWVVQCPGCDSWHFFDARWTFNGDAARPTFAPSMLVNATLSRNADGTRNPSAPRCHSFVRDGRIEFLGDCDHSLAGRTVDLPDVDS